MAEYSGISWTDGTLNFWWGCVKVSPGCQECYAERFSKKKELSIWGPEKTTSRLRTTGPWSDCLKWDAKALRSGERKRVFVQSMGDFFERHYQVNSWRDEACLLMERFKAIDVQLLTKRPENVLEMVPASWLQQWPATIWIGTSVENQETAESRIPALLQVPARVRFVSVEPMLEPIRLYKKWLSKIDWVIVGGESGPRHRFFDLEWARSIRDQCGESGVPFFMKQKGGYFKNESLLDLPVDLRIREFPVIDESDLPAMHQQGELF